MNLKTNFEEMFANLFGSRTDEVTNAKRTAAWSDYNEPRPVVFLMCKGCEALLPESKLRKGKCVECLGFRLIDGGL